MLSYGMLIERAMNFFGTDNVDTAQRHLASLFYGTATDEQIARVARAMTAERIN
jgi:TorA maturation chaperone TorD